MANLTRADLQGDRLQALVAATGYDLGAWGETELRASIRQVLHQRPHCDRPWIFAYGSLIWNPCLPYSDRWVVKLYGWHRRFCLWAPIGRGTLDHPGLVLGLEQGGCCHGVAYRLDCAEVEEELLLLWRREMVLGAYIPRWVKLCCQGGEHHPAQALEAIAFTVNRQHPNYTGRLTQERILRTIRTAKGELGSTRDYLLQTVAGLEQEGLGDRHLFHLRQQLARESG